MTLNVPARTIRLKGQAEYRDQGETLLSQPGDIVLIFRGQVRSLLMKCPDGCGETLVINLDARAGKAWGLMQRQNSLSIYPSVWRDGGCGSHFIVWRNRILWCDRWEEDNVEPDYDPMLERRVLHRLKKETFTSVMEIAHEFDEIPWEISRAARNLVRRGLAEEGRAVLRGSFRRR